MSENQRHTATCIVINDKSQGSAVPCLRCGGTFDHCFIKNHTSFFLKKF